MAEEEYFTWIDAEGRIHNTLKSSSSTATTPATAEEPEASYLTEEEISARLKQDAEDNPPFYIWIDSNGQRHTEEIKAAETAETDSPQLVSEQFFDHSLIPPLRLPAHIVNGPCCGQYASLFTDSVPAGKSVLFTRPGSKAMFRTRAGSVPAWFFHAGESLPYSLKLTLRGEHHAPALLALDPSYRPLHSIPRLASVYHEETWAQVANWETRIEINDAEVSAFILYFPAGADATVSAEIEWTPESAR